MGKITRRNFIARTGATGGIAMAMAMAYNPLAHGDDQKIRVGLIGVGGRCTQHLRDGIWDNDNLEIVSVADVYKPHQKGGVLRAWLANAQMTLEGPSPTAEQFTTLKSFTKPSAYYDYREMIANENLDAVIITTPPHTHRAITMDCLNAGKHVFCETPLATNIDDARAVVKKAHETGLTVQVGHQRRYHPNYNLAMNRCRTEEFLGRIARVETHRHQNSPGRHTIDPTYTINDAEQKFIDTDLEHHLNWRLYTEPAGGPCCSGLPLSIDTANWFCGSAPTTVYASGGTDYWRDGRTTPDNLSVLFDYTISRRSTSFVVMDGRSDLQDVHRLNRTYTLRCAYSFGMTNGETEIGEVIAGDQATLVLSPNKECKFSLELSSGQYRALVSRHRYALKVKHRAKLDAMTDEERRQFHITNGRSYEPPGWNDKLGRDEGVHAVGSEESAEVHQFRAFAHHIRHGGTPRANGMVGLAAVIAGASARKSLDTGNAVDIDPAWMEFDFDTPSITDYDHDVKAIEA